ncbi:P-loop NTPase fold protein [Nonomuraea guangzhouensis]|uniref:P-loop NTPase fold protein n=1 Tax=Nonomuraea guangzhouensis TaxID=1291555 RepID=A0ABW4GTH7_9ACTN|nr:P-loop NTPase fold protein [Nonomuraea guangzhouensis]
MAFLRLAVAVICVLAWPFAGARAAAGPEFLEEQVSIPLERLANGRWQIVLINPGPAVSAQVRLAGSIADALALQGDGRLNLPTGGTATLILVPGGRPHAGGGQLVLISTAGADRLGITVTEPPFLVRHWWVWISAVVMMGGIAARLWWRRRRRGHPATKQQLEEPVPASTGSPKLTHSDEPAQIDRLNREEYASHLGELARYSTPPMVIGIFGEWGTGKTSMLMQVRDYLRREAAECAHVWFDPWRHQYDENPVLPLLHVIVKDLGLENRETVRRTLRTISDVLGSLVLSATLKVSLPDVRTSIEAYDSEHFRIRSEHTRLDEYLGTFIRESLAARGKKRLVVFVDDLDRCDADRITLLLEALKLHFNRDNCVFVLGVAKGPLIAAVREKYQDPVGEYLDKIIQFPFEMPRLSEKDFDRYLEDLLPDEIRGAGDMLRSGLRRNPRTIKRFVNVLHLQHRVAKARGVDPYEVATLAAVLLLRDGAPNDYERITRDPALLQRIARQPDSDVAADGWSELTVRMVRWLGTTPAGVPDNVLDYIDLVRESPVSKPSDLVAGAEPVTGLEPVTELSFRDTLGRLAGLVHEHVVPDARHDDGLLNPLVRLPGAQVPKVTGLDEILALGDKLMITGAPGAGKSVLVGRLARRLAGRRASRVPAYLRFSELKTEYAAHERWVTHALVACYGLSLADSHAMVVRGSLVLVLDGLDALDQGKWVGFLRWAEHAACGVIMTAGAAVSGSAFTEIRLLGVSDGEARRRLESVLAAHHVDPSQLQGLTAELMSSPQLLAVLTRDRKWIDALPEERVDFLPWYAARAVSLTAGSGFDRDVVTRGLRELARWTRNGNQDLFSHDHPDVKSALFHAGIEHDRVLDLLSAAVQSGLLRERSGTYHFVHPLLRDHLADV